MRPKVDGATRLQIIWHVNIPSILPTIVIMLIFSCGGVLGVGFEKVYLMQNSLNLSASQVISTYVYEIGIRGGQFSYSLRHRPVQQHRERGDPGDRERLCQEGERNGHLVKKLFFGNRKGRQNERDSFR